MKKLLVIGFVWPEPKSSAAGNRMLQLIFMFQEMNYKVTFASAAQNLEFSEDLNNYNVTAAPILLNDSSFDIFCKNLQPDVVLFDRFLTEEQFGWRVTLVCKNAIKILDTEDLHSLRLCRQKAVIENKKFDIADMIQSDIAKREMASIYRCDLSLMV
ncbi:MAG: glycosyltransferase, partial [Flavobacterium sp.]|nr:glycosyltransferase [Flavobacterium sp.]